MRRSANPLQEIHGREATDSLIDIPFINNFQTRVPENIRGRSLSISVSAVKIFTPIGYILSGGIMEVVPAFYLPLCGGVLMLLYDSGMTKHIFHRKKEKAPGPGQRK